MLVLPDMECIPPLADARTLAACLTEVLVLASFGRINASSVLYPLRWVGELVCGSAKIIIMKLTVQCCKLSAVELTFRHGHAR